MVRYRKMKYKDQTFLSLAKFPFNDSWLIKPIFFFLRYASYLHTIVNFHTDKYLYKWIKRKFKKKEPTETATETNVEEQGHQTAIEERNEQSTNGQDVDVDAKTQRSREATDVEEYVQPTEEQVAGADVETKHLNLSTYERGDAQPTKKLPTDAFGDISFIPIVNKSGNTSKVGKYYKNQKEAEK